MEFLPYGDPLMFAGASPATSPLFGKPEMDCFSLPLQSFSEDESSYLGSEDFCPETSFSLPETSIATVPTWVDNSSVEEVVDSGVVMGNVTMNNYPFKGEVASPPLTSGPTETTTQQPDHESILLMTAKDFNSYAGQSRITGSKLEYLKKERKKKKNAISAMKSRRRKLETRVKNLEQLVTHLECQLRTKKSNSEKTIGVFPALSTTQANHQA